MSRILVIGDLHEPSTRKGYLRFCKDLAKKHKTNKTIFIGDVTDWHSISFHVKHPEMPSPKKEYELAHNCIQKWVKAFSKAIVILGNHDRRVIRLAETVNIPAKFLRDYKDIWDTPSWEWVDNIVIDDIYYAHGDGAGSGLYPAFTLVRKFGMSVVLGHHHSAAGIKWLVNPLRRMFGMDVGSGVDDRQLAFAYGKQAPLRSVISAGVIINGEPQLFVMPISKGEKYHDTEVENAKPKTKR